MNIRKRFTTKTRRWLRKGTATVEAAVCVPVLVIVCLGAIELNNQYYLRRSLVIAAFEAGRLVSQDGTRSEDIISFASNVLDERGVQSYTVRLEPRNLRNLDEGDEVMVTVTVDKKANQLVSFPMGGPTMTVQNFTVR